MIERTDAPVLVLGSASIHVARFVRGLCAAGGQRSGTREGRGPECRLLHEVPARNPARIRHDSLPWFLCCVFLLEVPQIEHQNLSRVKSDFTQNTGPWHRWPSFGQA